MGEVIYGVRTFDELIKIGWTANLAERLGGFGINRSQLHRLLFIVPGTREEEKVIHSLLTEHIARGREHYHPSAEVIELVNLMRANYDLPPMAA